MHCVEKKKKKIEIELMGYEKAMCLVKARPMPMKRNE